MIDVLGSGAVILGQAVVCDGFHRNRRVRVQTHIHDDHMTDFETSKGFQDILASPATYDLLVAEFNADLPVRDNLIALPPRTPLPIDDEFVTLVPSGHMLGSVQVLVETRTGLRLGYSGDFTWPIDVDDVIQCDALVVDSTYGSPDSIRDYTQEDAETRLVELLYRKLRRGSVHIHSHRGTIQRAVQIIAANLDDVPLICSDRLCREIAVYRDHGSAVAQVMPFKSGDARAALATRRYIRFYSKGDRQPVELEEGTRITLSAFMARRDTPVLELSERAYRVALSNHADFVGTLEYIRATGAHRVITDNTRTHGVELALAIRQRLGVDAMPSTSAHSHEWGAGG